MSFAAASCPAELDAAVLDTAIGRVAPLILAGAAGDMVRARVAAAKMLFDYDAQTDEELRLAAEISGFGFQVLEALSQAAEVNRPLKEVLRLRSCAVSLSRQEHRSKRKLDQLQRDRRLRLAQQPRVTVEPEAAKFSSMTHTMFEALMDGHAAVPLPGSTPPNQIPTPAVTLVSEQEPYSDALAGPDNASDSHPASAHILNRAASHPAAEPPATLGARAPDPAPTAADADIAAAASLLEAAHTAIGSAGKHGGLSWTQAFQKRQAAKRITETLKRKQAEHHASLNTADSGCVANASSLL